MKQKKRYSFIEWMVRLSERIKLHTEFIQIFYERNDKEELIRFFGGMGFLCFGILLLFDCVLSLGYKSFILGILGIITGLYFWDTAFVVSD